ncbi:MAG: hypothetical protein PUF51_07660 [Bifidobacteriaceae bacterium]|nr:hypothetical protein [Bifidobacteriaceae bacterium]
MGCAWGVPAAHTPTGSELAAARSRARAAFDALGLEKDKGED